MSFIARLRLTLLYAAPAFAMLLAALPPPSGLSAQAWDVAIIGTLMALWWASEIVPLAVTALLPVIAFPLLGIASIDETAASYAHPLIFLFLGGFLLSRAMERWGLHRRIALNVLRVGGSKPANVIASLMAATAFLSLWISNTATAMVMLPIGRSVAGSSRNTCRNASEAQHTDFGAALMLGVGYAATIGGMGSLIGTPPNALFAGYMNEAHGVEIGFARWMLLGLPVVFVLLPVTWWILTRLAFDIPRAPGEQGVKSAGHGSQPAVQHTRAPGPSPGPPPGPMSAGERRVAALMILIAGLWIFRPLINRILPDLGLSDPGIAVIGAVALFVVPADLSRRMFLLRWEDAARIRWDILILFGGGLALAGGIGSSGLAQWIGEASSSWRHLPPFLLIAAVTVVIVYLGELASNTAMAAVFLPIAGAAALGMGEDPLTLVLPIALAASLGFMLPVATPPNAIVFGSGAVTVPQMLRAGAILDLVGIVTVLVIGSLIGPLVFPTP